MDRPRFIVTNREISQTFNTHTVIMLSDIGYWVDNYDALKTWCQQHRSQVLGMTVEIPDAETVTAFLLKWQ